MPSACCTSSAASPRVPAHWSASSADTCAIAADVLFERGPPAGIEAARQLLGGIGSFGGPRATSNSAPESIARGDATEHRRVDADDDDGPESAALSTMTPKQHDADPTRPAELAYKRPRHCCCAAAAAGDGFCSINALN